MADPGEGAYQQTGVPLQHQHGKGRTWAIVTGGEAGVQLSGAPHYLMEEKQGIGNHKQNEARV